MDEGVEKVSRDYKELLELVRKVQAEQVTLAKEIEKEIDAELYKFHKKRQELKKVQNELEKKLELDPYELLKVSGSEIKTENLHKIHLNMNILPLRLFGGGSDTSQSFPIGCFLLILNRYRQMDSKLPLIPSLSFFQDIKETMSKYAIAFPFMFPIYSAGSVHNKGKCTKRSLNPVGEWIQ